MDFIFSNAPALFRSISGLSGCLGVGMAAYGAHHLNEVTSAQKLAWPRAVVMQLVHAVAILAASGASASAQRLSQLEGKTHHVPSLFGAMLFWTLGTVCFSGSIYSWTLGYPKGGRITPFGGVCFMIGWTLCAAGV